jgi:hypothetical protein
MAAEARLGNVLAADLACRHLLDRQRLNDISPRDYCVLRLD